MKRHIYFLLAAFFAALSFMWYLDVAHTPTSAERERMLSRVLPELISTNLSEIASISIAGDKPSVVLARGDDGQRWLLKSLDGAAADRFKVEAFLQNLKEMPRPPGAESLKGDLAGFGLDRPSRTISVYKRGEPEPIATLELGKVQGDRRFVRRAGHDEVDAADARVLAAADQPAWTWRDASLFDVAVFEVESFETSGPAGALRITRDEGRAQIVEPFRAPADITKVDGLLANLLARRVADREEGFVTRGADSLERFGLSKPTWVVRLAANSGKVSELLIGAHPPSRTDRVYARRMPQDDVVLIDSTILDIIGAKPVAFRSQRVVELPPSRVSALRVTAGGVEHVLVRTDSGWNVVSPKAGKADDALVAELLRQLDAAQTSEFFDASRRDELGLNRVSLIIEAWESDQSRMLTQAGKPWPEPSVKLMFGRRDLERRAYYAELAGDPTILALSSTFFDVPIDGPLAFRDRTIRNVLPGELSQINIKRGNGNSIELSPAGQSRDYAQWRMHKPVDAPVDRENVAALDAVLARLRAERLVTDDNHDASKFGLDRPFLEIMSKGSGSVGSELFTLKLGDAVDKSKLSRYAQASSRQGVFVLPGPVVRILSAEPHDRHVLSFPRAGAVGVTIRTSTRVAAFERVATGTGADGAPEWSRAPGSAGAITPAELASIGPLLLALSSLTAERFEQYEGAFAASSGLEQPRLTIEILMANSPVVHRVRVGAEIEPGGYLCAIGSADSGAIAVLSGLDREPWALWLSKSTPPSRELPSNPFAEPGAPRAP